MKDTLCQLVFRSHIHPPCNPARASGSAPLQSPRRGPLRPQRKSGAVGAVCRPPSRLAGPPGMRRSVRRSSCAVWLSGSCFPASCSLRLHGPFANTPLLTPFYSSLRTQLSSRKPPRRRRLSPVLPLEPTRSTASIILHLSVSSSSDLSCLSLLV